MATALRLSKHDPQLSLACCLTDVPTACLKIQIHTGLMDFVNHSAWNHPILVLLQPECVQSNLQHSN